MAVPGPVILDGLMIAFRPAEGTAVRFTTLVNPLTPLTVIVTVPWLPAKRGPTAVGLALMVKSTTFTVTINDVCERGPLVPVAMTV